MRAIGRARPPPARRGITTSDDGERIEPSGRWITGATAVGRDPAARATCVPLRMLMDVCRAHVGTTLATGASRKEVSASDATFSAVKSVSAVWAIANPQRCALIEHAHQTAVDRAIQYATTQVPMKASAAEPPSTPRRVRSSRCDGGSPPAVPSTGNGIGGCTPTCRSVRRCVRTGSWWRSTPAPGSPSARSSAPRPHRTRPQTERPRVRGSTRHQDGGRRARRDRRHPAGAAGRVRSHRHVPATPRHRPPRSSRCASLRDRARPTSPPACASRSSRSPNPAGRVADTSSAETSDRRLRAARAQTASTHARAMSAARAPHRARMRGHRCAIRARQPSSQI